MISIGFRLIDKCLNNSSSRGIPYKVILVHASLERVVQGIVQLLVIVELRSLCLIVIAVFHPNKVLILINVCLISFMIEIIIFIVYILSFKIGFSLLWDLLNGCCSCSILVVSFFVDLEIYLLDFRKSIKYYCRIEIFLTFTYDSVLNCLPQMSHAYGLASL